MMRIILAFKAFLRAFTDPNGTKRFLEGETTKTKAIKDNRDFKEIEAIDQSHLRLLNMLQQSSRLIDFLQEDITGFDDAQIGGAVRKIHDDCKKCLEDIVTIRPVMDDKEGSKITVPQGYDPSKIKVVGKVKGEPPYVGILVHKGWKAHKRSLPKKVGDQTTDVICPAEIEVR